MLRGLLPTLALAACSAGAAAAQAPGSLRARFTELFRFGGSVCGTNALFCLVNSSGASAADAFSTNANTTAQSLTRYVQAAISQGIANAPIPSTSSGTTFRLTGAGVPVRNADESAGPIFGERATTLGRGRLLVGANLIELSLDQLRGTPIDEIRFNIAQRDLPPGGGELGDPVIEQTYLAVATHIGLQARVTNLFATYGFRDWLDLGVTVPFVQASLSGYSDARIVPGTDSDPAAGFSFGGPPEDPRLTARTEELSRATAFGLGDVSLRGKARLSDPDARLGLGLQLDARLPTGNSDDFMGTGRLWLRVLGIASWRVADGVVPHANLGYYRRPGEGLQDAAVAALGFDARVSDALTLAGDLLGTITLGANPLASRTITISGAEPILTSNIPTRRDDTFDAALGAKYTIGAFTVFANGIVALNAGGLRGGLTWASGVQAAF
ncbi:MAG: hypothetical protein R2909_07975 [Gemmatimonadales bacterium]